MKFVKSIGCAAMLLLAWQVAAGAEKGSAGGGFTITEAKTTKEVVEAVDYATRKVTLKDGSGQVRIIRAGSDIHNLNRLQVGDEVTIETFQTIQVEVKPGTGDTMNVGYEGQTAPPLTEKPSGVRTVEGKLRSVIEAIDYQKRTITFKGRSGQLVTYQIGPEAKRFNEIRRGDMLWAEYSQTVKLTVK